MLPEALSNGMCSLVPNKDRLSMVCDMTLNTTGDITNYQFYPAVICSKARLTYETVYHHLYIDDTQSDYQPAVKTSLQTLKALYTMLAARRTERGSIDFEIPEAKVILDEKGKPIEIKKYELTISNNIIEDFMLAANETVAEKFFWLEAPFMYRVHEVPDSEKIEDFAKFIYNYGYRIKGLNKLYSKSFQEVLEKVKGKPEERMISTLLLRSMQQAKYSPENLGHFGLAAQYYCHFTSPIRRYPDLFIHRVMSELIENDYKFKNDKRAKKLRKLAVEGSKTASQTERNAQMAERDSVELKMVEYMSNFVGEEFDAIISSVTSFGFFVELQNTVEGLVRVEDLADDYYVYNEKQYALIGERNRKVYKLGDMVKVVLVRADVETKKIDFVLAN